MLYVVTYTLKPKRDATTLITELQNSPGWWHYLDDTWLIATHETREQLWGRIAKKFIKTDRILIVQVTPDARYWGWLPQEAWDWLDQHQNY